MNNKNNSDEKYIVDISNNEVEKSEDSMGIIIEMGVDPYASSSSQSRDTTPERFLI